MIKMKQETISKRKRNNILQITCKLMRRKKITQSCFPRRVASKHIYMVMLESRGQDLTSGQGRVEVKVTQIGKCCISVGSCWRKESFETMRRAVTHCHKKLSAKSTYLGAIFKFGSLLHICLLVTFL